MNTESIFLVIFIILAIILAIFIVKKINILSLLNKNKSKNKNYAISQITDVEGNLSYFTHMINNDKLVKFDWFGNLTFKSNPIVNNHHFVITGDAVDHGVGNMEITSQLLKFKKKYPNNVHLILGNRDVNKFRLIDELQHPDELNDKDIDPIIIDKELIWLRQPNTPPTGDIFNSWLIDKKIIMDKNEEGNYIGNEQNWIIVLKFILDKTMGASKSFENTKQILKLQSDLDVYKEYYYSIRDGGWLYEYLKHCDILKIIHNNLFLHGAITDRFLWEIPREGLSDKTTDDIKLSSMTPDDFHKWVDDLNNYYHDNLKNKNYSEIARLGLVSVITENWVHNGNNTIVDKHTDRLLNEMKMSVFTGHKPHHDMPSTIKMDNSSYIVVISDTSYSDGPPKEFGRKALYNTMIRPNDVLIYGCNVCDNDDQCDYSEGCNVEYFEPISKTEDTKVGKPFQDDLLKTQLLTNKNKTDYINAWWVKAIKNKNNKKTAIISKIDGFKAETKKVPL